MTLRMDEGGRHAHNHRRTALPKRTSLTESKTTMRKVPISSGKPPFVAPRRKGDVAKSIKGSASPAIATPAAVACAGRVGGGSGAKRACADGSTPAGSVARVSSKKNGIERTTGRVAGTGNDRVRVGGHSLARKRVRVVDQKLGTFVVFLARYEGDHNDVCDVCDKGGDLLCCDFCNLVYHLACVTPRLTEVPSEELWLCPACTSEVTNRQMSKRRRLEDSGRTSPGPGSGRGQGQSQSQSQVQVQDKVPSFCGVKPENGGFRAFVLYKNHTLDLGLHPSAQAAARAYDRKALSLFGDSAKCNFPADEQMEVEGVGSDGIAVKGAVRSFHQWRAEMQWGNKKRHLGFFDRLDDAAYAYNRAALHMNGPETPLNPIKEGYMPPPPTGAPVKVPRNKLFVQQLPLPLSARAKPEDGVVQSAQQQRRRYQMQGKYHAPLVGESHQVSYLPPLPPPSRPWLGMTPSAQSKKTPEVSPTELSMSTIGTSVVKEPASGSMGHGTSDAVSAARRCESGADVGERPARQAAVEGALESSVPSTVTPSSQSPTGGHETGLTSGDAVRWGVDSASPAAVAAPPALAATGKSLAWSSGAEDLAHQANVVDPKFDGRANPNESVAQVENAHAVTPERGSQVEEATASRPDVKDNTEIAPATPLEVQKPAPAPSRVPKPREATEKFTIRIPRRVILSYGAPETSIMCRPVSAPSVAHGSPNGGEDDDEVSDESDPALPEVSPSTVGEGEGGHWSDDSATPGGEHVRPKMTSSSCIASCAERSSFREGRPAPMLGPGTFLPPPGAEDGETIVNVAGFAQLAAGQVSAIRLPRPPGSSTDVPTRYEEGGFAMVPPRASCAWSERTTSEESAGVRSSCGGLSNLCEVTPPSSEAPPIPDLSFEDVAELVWDPRSGPKPKGAGDGKKDENARRIAVERTMWERDSTLLGRVAPAYVEKAMQVLQTCRHDVEKAAQMLSVRHGIHVIGLSNVRKTRHSLAEQQAAGVDGPEGLDSGSSGAGRRGADAASLRALGRKADAQGYSREEIGLAGKAFMQHGRNLNEVTKVLGWKKSRVVNYYHCVWKFSPAYQVWKARHRQAGLSGDGNNAVSGSATSWLADGGQAKPSSDGMRWRGSRLRTLKTSSSSSSQ